MSKILIVAEHDGAVLNPATAKTVKCAAEFGAERVAVVVFAAEGAEIARAAAGLAGVSHVLQVDDPVNEHPLAAVIAPQVAKLAGDYTHVLGPSTTFGKDLMPRVAAQLGVGQVSDIQEVLGPYRFRRPVYAGNAIIVVQADESRTLVATVRTASYQPADEGGSAELETVSVDAQLPGHTRFKALQTSDSNRPDLQTAPYVVSGGRAVGSEENFELIFGFADKIGAAVGASRAAVDAGFVPNELQVGQTGKIIAPDLYIAIGISGAIQHLTGIKDAGTIVAINKDPEAPIFEIADIGLVGDLFEIVPQLEERLGS